MSENKNNKSDSQRTLKGFFIKLISISIAVIFVFNLIFNLFFSERLEKIDKVFSLDKRQSRLEVQEKIREEIKKGLNKENLISEEDKVLLYKLYLKLEKEFQNLDKNKL